MLSCKNTPTKNSFLVHKDDLQEIKISLAQWSFHKALLSGEMTHLDFIVKASELGFDGLEYVSTFFKDKVDDSLYLDSMNKMAAQHNIVQLLIMVDIEKELASLDEKEREQAVKEHYRWIDAAQILGCHSVRVNLFGQGSREELASVSIQSLQQLCSYAAPKNINILVENHAGLSADGLWLSEVVSKVDRENCGTLPDFGNFCLKRKDGAQWGKPCVEEYDKYKGVYELMPLAKAVSAKSYDFGELGYETTIDYCKMLNIVKDSGYSGFIGVEYEGDRLDEERGVLLTKSLIEKCLEINN